MTAGHPLELDNFFATIQNPYPVYTYLRENEPVRWNPMFNCFMLSRYDDVNAALLHFDTVGELGDVGPTPPLDAINRASTHWLYGFPSS